MSLTKTDIDWLKREFLPGLATAVQDGLKDKLNEISTKLDTFVGDIQDKREAQELHAGQHKNLEDRLHTVEKHVGITP